MTDLAERDLGAWYTDDHEGGRGRPVPVFRLTPSDGADTNGVFPEKTGIVSAVGKELGNNTALTPWDDPIYEWRP